MPPGRVTAGGEGAGDDSSMKTNMKNKKTMLAAILVVAAFAAFSAAAVFEDAQSDASEITGGYTLVTGGALTITADTPDQNFALVAGDDGITVSVEKGVSFTGKLYFGTGDVSTFTADTVLSLDKVGGKTKAVSMTQAAAGAPVVITGDVTGTVQVTEGKLQLGGDKAFNGTASGNTVTIKSQNTAGLIIVASAEKTTDQIYGDVVSVKNEDNPVYAIDIDDNVKFDIYKSAGNLKLSRGDGAGDLEVNINGTFDVVLTTELSEPPAPKALDLYHTVVNVNGAMNFDTALDLAAPVGGSAVFNVNGEMKFTNVTEKAGIGGERMINGAEVNAAFYSTGSDSATTKFTHIYTTLENAMSKSADIFVTGTHFITEDTTLTGTSTTEDKNKITFLTDAKVYTGVDTTDEDAVFTAVTVTVPVTTELTVNGSIDVQAGKLVVNQKDPVTEEGDILYSAEVEADVFMVVDKAGVFTDLATALDISKSGDEVKIRSEASNVSVKADATLKEGVTLDANKAKITILGDVVLTVNGAVKDAGDMTVDGTLVLNSADFKFVTGSGFNIGDEGVLTFGQAYDNSEDTDFKELILTVSDAEGSVINVYGKVNLEAEVDILGKINVYGTLVLDIDTTKSVAELFVADTGDVKASNTKDVTVMEFTAGTAPENLEQYVNNAKAMVKIDTGGTYTVYGEAANVKFVEYKSGKYVSQTGLESTAYYFEKGAVLYATVGVNNAVPAIEIYALETPDVNGQEFQAWYATSSKVFMVELDAKIGAFAKVYADFDAATITVVLENVQNATWFINDVRYDSGAAVVVWAQEYTVKLVADNGFKADGKVLVNDAAFAGALADGDRLTFDGSVNASAAGTDMQTILLAVIAVAAIVIAVVFVVRLMRS